MKIDFMSIYFYQFADVLPADRAAKCHSHF